MFLVIISVYFSPLFAQLEREKSDAAIDLARLKSTYDARVQDILTDNEIRVEQLQADATENRKRLAETMTILEQFRHQQRVHSITNTPISPLSPLMTARVMHDDQPRVSLYAEMADVAAVATEPTTHDEEAELVRWAIEQSSQVRIFCVVRLVDLCCTFALELFSLYLCKFLSLEFSTDSDSSESD